MGFWVGLADAFIYFLFVFCFIVVFRTSWRVSLRFFSRRRVLRASTSRVRVARRARRRSRSRRIRKRRRRRRYLRFRRRSGGKVGSVFEVLGVFIFF